MGRVPRHYAHDRQVGLDRERRRKHGASDARAFRLHSMGGRMTRIHLPSLFLGGILVVSLAVNLHAQAQEQTPTSAETVDVTIGGYTFPELDSREPVLILPVSRTT